jgi:gluconate:H+ symporter, GntP family
MLLPLLAAEGTRLDPTMPLVSLGLGIAIVLGMILVLRANAFMALITAAMVVSLIAPGELGEKIARVARAFGDGCGSIGIVIALAAVIGQCMMDSGAADRVVRSFMNLLGEKRTPFALMGSGYVLAVPVFFDTVFYLLVPLARSVYRKTRKNYLKCLLAIAAGGAITHTLVPPTPGPLAMAVTLGIDLGTMILVGALVALPAALAGLLCAGVMNKLMPIPMRTLSDDEDTEPIPDDKLPGLFVSLLPVVLPVILIGFNTVVDTIASEYPRSAAVEILPYAKIIGNPNFSLLISTIIALGLLYKQTGKPLKELADIVEISLMSGGVIILITAGGVAFGQSLKFAQVGEAIESIFSPADNSKEVGTGLALSFEENRIVRSEGDFVADNYVVGGSAKVESAEDSRNNGKFTIIDVTATTLTVAPDNGPTAEFAFVENPDDRNVKLSGKTTSEPIPGMPMLFLCFGVAAMLKLAQGSSTSAMIITSSMIAPMVADPTTLGFNAVYLATAIGAGSLIGSWMNDSGFWIFAKMGGLTETEALKSWSIMLIVLGSVSMATTVLLVKILPLTSLIPAG